MAGTGRHAAEDLTARARIRDAALELFATRGVRGTTIRGVAEAAGVSPGLVQHHFGTKQGLREACDDYVMQSIRTLKSQALDEGSSDPGFLSAIVRGSEQLRRYLALASAEKDPAGLSDDEALALLHADGPELDALMRIADDLRREAVGDDVTYVVTRNINFTNVCYTGCRFCAFAQRRTDADAYTLSLSQVGDRVDEAWEAGATEVCMQGGIHPDLPGTAYFDLAREVKRRAPDIHLHSYSPMEVVNGASRTDLSIREWLQAAKEAGVDSLPGTAAEILDDDVRWVLTKGKLPADQWIEVVTTAHELGIPTTSTMMYGHVDTPAHWVAHLKLLRSIQERTGGFTEFVLLPFVHHNSPIYLAGLARPGPTVRENLAVHALARILLHGAIPNIQTSWVKLGDELCVRVLRGGVNDLGGTLMEETISRMAGSENGSFKTISSLEAIAAAAGRPARQRTTTYGEVPAERLEAARRTDGVGQFGKNLSGNGRTSLPLVAT